jgi:predicted hotdog family 3-hydroxylacyl-ACP dehydratase
MLDRAAIRALIPHQGAMCLLDDVRDWSATRIAATGRSHLDPANPLRRDGRLAAVCGCEYAFQAAALHGALAAGGIPQPAGWLARLQIGRLGATRLDDPARGTLLVEAMLELAEPGGLIYGFRLTDEQGAVLLEGRGTIVLPCGRT